MIGPRASAVSPEAALPQMENLVIVPVRVTLRTGGG